MNPKIGRFSKKVDRKPNDGYIYDYEWDSKPMSLKCLVTPIHFTTNLLFYLILIIILAEWLLFTTILRVDL